MTLCLCVQKNKETMNKQELFENIKRKKSFLCVGLDTDIKKIPEHLLKKILSLPSTKLSLTQQQISALPTNPT